MRDMQKSIIADQFPKYVQEFFLKQFPGRKYPKWAVDALSSVNIHLINPSQCDNQGHGVKVQSVESQPVNSNNGAIKNL